MLPPIDPPPAMATSENQNKPATIGVMLTAYQRTEHLADQYHAVLDQTIKPSEILIWNQSGKSLGGLDRHAITIPYNMGVWPRFSISQYIETDYICVFDDDTIPGNRWLENCLRVMSQLGPCLLGGNGVCFVDGDRENRAYFGWCNPQERIVEVDIVGHSFFFPRELLAQWDVNIHDGCQTCGEDYYLAYQAQRRGWKTYVPPHPPNDKSWWSSLKGQLGDDSKALYKQPGEPEKKLAFHNRLKEMGWKPSAVTFHDGAHHTNAISLASPSIDRCPHCGGALNV